MPKIRAIQTRAVKAPLDRPHKTASGTVADSLLVLIDIDCGEVVGRAYVFVYSPAAVAPIRSLVQSIGELLVGEDLQPTQIYDSLQAQFRILGTTGLVGYALGGIDMALWDAFARAADKPLWQVLGGVPKAVPIYESMGMMAPSETLEDARAAANMGVTAFKVKAGHVDPIQDLRVGEALREVAGSGDIMFDYNQAFTPSQATKRLAGLADLGLAWIEEPVAAGDLFGHAQVRRSTSVPVQTGENLWNPTELQRVLAAGAADLVMIDASRIGGVTGWLRAAAIAQAHSVPLSTHFYPEVSIHTMSVTPTAHYVEWLDVSSSILENPLEPVNGMVTPTDEPGSGISWDHAAVDRYTI